MRVRRDKPVIYITALILALIVSSGTAFGTEQQLAEPEIVTAPSNSLIKNPTPRVQLEIEPYQSKRLRKATEAALPAKYDLRDEDLITSVKDQGSFGTCWAFAAMACVESSAIKSGIADPKVDLSEAHLAYYYYNRVGDPLGNTNGDKNKILAKDYKGNRRDYRDMGGDDKKTILALSGWTGAAAETIAPYSSLLAGRSFPAGKAYQNSYILKNGYILPTERSTMKQALMKHGALNIGYYADSNYYTEDDIAAYCDRPLTANHEVAVVGWDDNYSKTNFRDGCQPKSDGAWIVKNSWGSTSGKNGYFYLSYEDQTLCDVVVYDFQAADTYDYNYQYDGTANSSWWENIKNGDQFSNVYEIKGNKAGYDEVLSAIGFVSYTPGSQYSIQIYKNPKDKKNPQSGTPLLKEPVTGTVENAGFMTKELGSDLVLPQKTVYSIVITFTKVPQGGATMGVELNERLEGYIDYQADVKPGQSFVKENSVWKDMSDYEACFRIKGFTRTGKTKTPSTVEKLQISKSSASMKLGRSLTLKARLLPENASNKKVTWKSSNQKIATVDAKGRVTAVSSGNAVITAVSASNPAVKGSCKVKVSAAPYLQGFFKKWRLQKN